jgi:hypothetical protein
MFKPLVLSFAVTFPVAAVDFVQDVQPILKERCYGCQGTQKQEAAFRLDHSRAQCRFGARSCHRRAESQNEDAAQR